MPPPLFPKIIVAAGFCICGISAYWMHARSYTKIQKAKDRKLKIQRSRPMTVTEVIEKLKKQANQSEILVTSEVYVEGITSQVDNLFVKSNFRENEKLIKRVDFNRQVPFFEYHLFKKTLNNGSKFKNQLTDKKFLNKCSQASVPYFKISDHSNSAFVTIIDQELFGSDAYETKHTIFKKGSKMQEVVSGIILASNLIISALDKNSGGFQMSNSGFVGIQKNEYGVKFNSTLQILGDFIYNAKSGILRCHRAELIGSKQDITKALNQTLTNAYIENIVSIALGLFCTYQVITLGKEIMKQWKSQKKLISSNGKLKDVKEVFMEKTDNFKCINCIKNDRNTILLPCAHFQLCSECASQKNLLACPLCKKKIIDSVCIFSA